MTRADSGERTYPKNALDATRVEECGRSQHRMSLNCFETLKLIRPVIDVWMQRIEGNWHMREVWKECGCGRVMHFYPFLNGHRRRIPYTIREFTTILLHRLLHA
jgi:hypothetical protein